MLFGFIFLGVIGGAAGALITLLVDGSLMLAALSYSLTGMLTALIASLSFVIVSDGQRHNSDIALVNQNH